MCELVTGVQTCALPILIEETDANAEQEKVEVLDKIKSYGRHLLSLVADVLDFAKVSSDDVGILDREFSMDAFIDDIASTCSGLDRKSVVKGKSESVRVDLGGRRILKKKTISKKN